MNLNTSNDVSPSGDSHHKHYGFETDLSLFNVYTTRPLADYLYLKLKDCGLFVESTPFPLNLDIIIEDTWTALVVNPENDNVLYAINCPDRFALQTLCAMLSVQFPRHEVLLTKFQQTRMAYRNGVVVKDNLEFNSSLRQPKDWN